MSEEPVTLSIDLVISMNAIWKEKISASDLGITNVPPGIIHDIRKSIDGPYGSNCAAGGRYVDKEVVVDGSLVTSRWPADLPAFMREIMKMVKSYSNNWRIAPLGGERADSSPPGVKS